MQVLRSKRLFAGLGTDGIDTYEYDPVGNLLQMHQTRGGTTTWRRRYRVTSNIGGLNKTEEIETLHVMDDQRRIAMVESKTVDAGAAVGSVVPRARYHSWRTTLGRLRWS